MESEQFDVVIIGGGQGASLARLLGEGGKTVALVEKEYLGGTCVNYGCTPTKAHLAAAKRAYDVRCALELGVQIGGDVRVDLPQIVARTQSIIRDFRGELNEEAHKTPGVTLVCGRARFVGTHRIEVENRRLEAQRIVLAVGARTQLPDVEGLDAVRCLTHREMITQDELPEHLLVLGGGYIACEFGQMFRRFGSQITIVQKGEQLLDREDEDVADAIAEFLRDEGLDVRLGCDLERIEPKSNGFRAHFSDHSYVDATHLLIATGQTPNTDDMGLENTEIKRDKSGHIEVRDDLKAAPGVWALGDCKGGPAFTHIAYDDACRLASHFLEGKPVSIKNRMVPYTVFTDPQLGRIGLNECEARENGVSYRVAKLEVKETARGIETGQTRGFYKVLIGDDDQILGAAMLAAEGGELMGALQIAIMGHLRFQDLQFGTFAHPTWIEGFNLIFQKVDCDAAVLKREY